MKLIHILKKYGWHIIMLIIVSILFGFIGWFDIRLSELVPL